MDKPMTTAKAVGWTLLFLLGTCVLIFCAQVASDSAELPFIVGLVAGVFAGRSLFFVWDMHSMDKRRYR